MAKTYIIGNWKMNQSLAEVNSFFSELREMDIQEGNL